MSGNGPQSRQPAVVDPLVRPHAERSELGAELVQPEPLSEVLALEQLGVAVAQ